MKADNESVLPQPVTRRDFFGGAALAAGTLATAAGVLAPVGAAQAASGRPVVTGGLALEIDGVFVGFALSAEYSGNETRVVSGIGSGGISILASQGVVVRTLKLRVPAAMAAKLHNWILVDGFASLVSLITFHGVTLEELYRLEIRDARIAEFALSTLDATDVSAPVTIEVIVSMREARHVFSSKGRKMPALATKPPLLATNMFQLFIQGYESATSRISRVESIGRFLPVPSAERSSEKQVAASKPMSVFLDVDAARPLMEWCDGAARGSIGERPGLLNLLSTDGKVQATIDLIGLFPQRVSSPFPGNANQLPLVEVVLESREQRYNFKNLVG